MSATDVTYRRRVEASLMQAQKVESLGRLATGIAHDFNNLLTAVLGGADLVAEMLPPELPVQADLARIVEAAERGAALTHQLLGYARRQPVQPRVIEVAQQVRAAAEMIERVMREDVRLVVTIAEPGLRVKLDPNQFDQVLLNLAVNARDAMPAGGVLTIEVDGAPRLATEVVGAGGGRCGCGIPGGSPKEIRDRIFEPFFTTKSPGEGTGLGLATCFGIVAQNGGQIAVESGSGGTMFEVTLPRVDEEPETRPKAPSLPPRSIEGTVLLVEDDDMVREMARRALARAGLRVVEAASGEAALAIRARGVAFDAVVTDVVMPGMDGRAVADALGEGGRVPVLFTSGHADNLLGERGIIRAGTNFLQKPYSAEALCQRVRSMLGQQLAGEPAARS
ncbi:MAG: response regulator [bacterium]